MSSNARSFLVSERTDELPAHAVACRLRAGMRGREHVLASRHRHVDGEVMTAELHHPRLGVGRLAQDADVILGAAESDGRARACESEHFGLEILVGIDDGHGFRESFRAQRRGDEREGRLLLRRRHVAELEAVPLRRADLHRDARRQVRPDDSRFLVEVEVRFPPLRLVERRQKRVSRRNGARCDARAGPSVEKPPTRRLRRRRPGPQQALDEAGLTWLTPSENGGAYATRSFYSFFLFSFYLTILSHTPCPRRGLDRYLVKSLVHAAAILQAFQSPGEVLRLRDVVERTGFGKVCASASSTRCITAGSWKKSTSVTIASWR